ncbi:MAG: FAD-binding oxidoreductase, partial [Sneathiella sp.]
QQFEVELKGLDQGNGILILTDMFGSTPSNIACAVSDRDDIRIIAGLNLPMESRKRQIFSFSCRMLLEKSPIVVDPTGVHFRHDGNLFYAGCVPPKDKDPNCSDTKIDYDLFEEYIWPILSYRVPAFQKITMEKARSEHYTYNVLDQSPVLGPHPEINNFYFANGFMGRSAQASPAIGRAIAELIIFGEYRSLNLSRFSFARMVTGEALLEHNALQ